MEGSGLFFKKFRINPRLKSRVLELRGEVSLSSMISFCMGFIAFYVGSLSSGPCSWAGIIMAPVPATAPLNPDETFVESRFGSASQLEGDQPSELGAQRHPAGLEFSRETGQPKSNPVILSGIGEEGAPSSPANLNPKPSSGVRNGVQEVALIAGDLGFFPKTVFVTRDIPVKLFVTGASKKPLCLMMDFFQIRKQVHSQKIEEINFTPTLPGQFRFYCPVNGMEGTLLVKELSTVAHVGVEKKKGNEE